MNIVQTTVRWLGQPSADLRAWETYLQALKADLRDSWARAVNAYNGLKKTRETLGLPFMVQQGAPESAAPGMSSAAAWAPDLEQNATDLMAMVQFIDNVLSDVIAGKRTLDWNQTAGEFQAEALPTDILRLAIQNGVPVLLDKSGNVVHPVPDKGIGMVGLPAILWAVVGAPPIALPFAAYWLVKNGVDNLSSVSEQKTIRTIAEKSYECVQSKACTPEEAAKINTSLYSGAAGVHTEKAKEEAAKGKPTTDITKAITTIALVGLGIAIVYAIIRLSPAPRGRTTALAPARLDEN